MSSLTATVVLARVLANCEKRPLETLSVQLPSPPTVELGHPLAVSTTGFGIVEALGG